MMKDKPKTKKPYISIIIPLYNEERRINNVSKIYKYFKSLRINYEVILINDGSTDQTIEKLKILSKKQKKYILY